MRAFVRAFVLACLLCCLLAALLAVLDDIVNEHKICTQLYYVTPNQDQLTLQYEHKPPV